MYLIAAPSLALWLFINGDVTPTNETFTSPRISYHDAFVVVGEEAIKIICPELNISTGFVYARAGIVG